MIKLKPSSYNQGILGNKFERIKRMRNHQKRGYKFEELIYDMLRFYGMRPHRLRGKTKSGDQIDVLAEFEGKQLLIETSYTEKPTGLPKIGELSSKLDRRPPTIIGIWFSMSDFTDEAIEDGSTAIKKKPIVLFNRIEIESIFGWGETDFERLLGKKLTMQSKDSKIFFQTPKKETQTFTYESYYNLTLGRKKVNWIQTPSSDRGCLVFSPLYYGFTERSYIIEESIGMCHLDEIIEILRIYNEIFGLTDKSAFCINQTNYSWFGLGPKRFIQALKGRKKRYKDASNIRLHHSEAAVFMDEIPGWNGGIFSLSMQPSADRDVISHVDINFQIEQMPFTKNRYEKFFEVLELEPECIVTSDLRVAGRISVDGVKGKSLNNVGFLKTRKKFEGKSWIEGIVCDNPFLKKDIRIYKHDEVDTFWIDNWTANLLSSFKKIIVFLPSHHEEDKNIKKYFLREVRITNIPCSGFAALCVNAIGDWDSEDIYKGSVNNFNNIIGIGN